MNSRRILGSIFATLLALAILARAFPTGASAGTGLASPHGVLAGCGLTLLTNLRGGELGCTAVDARHLRGERRVLRLHLELVLLRLQRVVRPDGTRDGSEDRGNVAADLQALGNA
jgi:hypothetical protein